MINGWVEDNYMRCHYVNNVLHNDNGPAVIWHSGSQEYYHYGKLHREDGPAYINYNGNAEYWLFGILVEEKRLAILGLNNFPKDGFSKDQVMMFSLLCMGET